LNTTVFLAAFSVYILFLIWLGWFVSRKQESGEDFLLAGRGLPVFLILGTTVATMVGTGSSIGAVGFGYENGWGGALYGIGGAIGILLAAWWFAPVRELRFMTMSEELSYYAGASRLVKNLTGVLIFLACIGWLGAHILGGGMYLAWIAGMDIQAAKITVALGFSIYIIIGGYRAVVWTDTIQVIILFFGFMLMAFLAIQQSGGWEALMSVQPEGSISTLGVERMGALHALSLVMVIAVGVLATPSFRQRIYSSKSVSGARTSFVWSGGIYLFFSFIPALIGMAAFALNPDLENRNFAFPFLAIEVLPLHVGVIVLIAGLSATMSSASSDAIAGVTILMRDLFVMVTGNMPSREKVIYYSRIALVAVIGLALLMALTSDDIISYITNMIATIMSGLFTCGVLGRFWQRFNWQGAVASLIAGSAVSLAVLISEYGIGYWGNPIIPAVIGSILFGVIVCLLTPKSMVTKEGARAILDREREEMEGLSN
jgi:solute:Na+ symporter, SSS family